MLQNVTPVPSRRSLEFGIYRDGDNNLDRVQSTVIDQAVKTSGADSTIEFTVEDTTARHGDRLHTDEYTISDGTVGHVTSSKAHDMSSEKNLASFVAQTLDRAEQSGAKQTWIDLVDHGGGDGGGLETRDGSCMSMPDIAQAIADGIALHAGAHPEDATRGVDGVVANQCLMDTMGFADALSHAGVRYLAASPETMIAPGVPSNVAHAIASNENDPGSMGGAVVRDVMRAQDAAAAFDVIDLDPAKVRLAESAIKRLNDDVAVETPLAGVREALRDDARSVEGMVRFPGATKDMPWHADRPAIAFYDAVASDGRLDARLRGEASAASDAVRGLVLAHSERRAFGPFGGSNYSDAVGPTVHLPTSRGQIDPWAAAGVSETDNAFYRKVDESSMTRVLA
jgi:hypothetical protein